MEDQFVAKKGRTYYKAIAFCSHPLAGQFRFEDKFQIYPLISEEAPKSDKIKIHPFIIEYWIDTTPDMEVPKELDGLKDFVLEHTYSNNYQKKILMLLSSITNYRFFYPAPELKWFVDLLDGASREEVNSQ